MTSNINIDLIAILKVHGNDLFLEKKVAPNDVVTNEPGNENKEIHK